MGKLGKEYNVQQLPGSEVKFFFGLASWDFFNFWQRVREPRRLNESRAFAFLRYDAAQIPRAELSVVWLLGIYSRACDRECENELWKPRFTACGPRKFLILRDFR